MSPPIDGLLAEARTVLRHTDDAAMVAAKMDKMLRQDLSKLERARLLVAKIRLQQQELSHSDAAMLMDEAVELLRSDGPAVELLDAISYRSVMALLMQDTGRCMDLAVEALHLIVNVDQSSYEYGRALSNLSLIYRELGAFEQAFDLSESAFQVLTSLDQETNRGVVGFNLIEAALACRRGLRDAEESRREYWLQVALSTCTAIGPSTKDAPPDALAVLACAEAALESNDLVGARVKIDVAQEIVAPGTSLLYAHFGLTHGRLLSREGHPAEAVAAFDAVDTLFAHDPNHAMTLLRERSRAHAAVGNLEQALADSQAATEQALGRQARNIGLLMSQVVHRAELERAGLELQRHSEALTAQIRRDPLTGLVSRTWLDRSMDSCAHEPGRVCVLVIDIDHFKRVNDRFGHLVGDEALRLVGEAILTSTRTDDLAARFGGEEFVVLAQDCSLDDAMRRGERIRETVEALDLKAIGVPHQLTVSVGVAEGPAHEVTEVLRSADARLYQAKANGRNNVHGPRSDSFGSGRVA